MKPHLFFLALLLTFPAALHAADFRAGRPLAVLGNFSMHYFGDKDISADYFGLFAEGLKTRLAASAPGGKAPFVGIMSHGCSGDIYRVDYKVPEKDRPKPTIQQYADGLLDIAMKALAGIQHRADADRSTTACPTSSFSNGRSAS